MKRRNERYLKNHRRRKETKRPPRPPPPLSSPPTAITLFSFKLIGSGDCSKRAGASDVRRGRSNFTYTTASTPVGLTNSFFLPFEHIQHLHAKLKASSLTSSLQNTHARKLKSSCDGNFQGFVMR